MTYDPLERPRPPQRGSWLPVLLLLLVVGLGLWWFWSRHGAPTDGLNPNAAPRPVVARGDLAADETATIELFKRAAPSVVHITNLAVRRNRFTLNVQQIPQGTGTGFVWDEDGHIVTNYHVIRGGDAFQVVLADQTKLPARVVGGHADKDLAVLHVTAPKGKLRPLQLGRSDKLQVGQKAFAIGNPFGLDQSLTTGVVSALGREIQVENGHTIKDMIQTNAAINPGNSGGPLLDSAGLLIGVNAAIYSPSGVWAGIGFAIPVDEVNQVVPQLIRHGRVTRPGLGVYVLPDQIARQQGIKGVIIREVRPDSPAEKAGLRPIEADEDGGARLGDVIVAIDGKPIRSVNDLFAALEKHKPGDTVTVTVLRHGERTSVEVTLADVQQ